MKKMLHSLCLLVLVVSAVGGSWVSPVSAHADAVTFNVDTLSDSHDSNIGDSTCYDGVSGCSLRAAIEQAFTLGSSGNPVTIHFWSGISGGTIYLNSTYGAINWAASYVTVDGQTNDITVSGASLSGGQSIFKISGDYNTISHLTIRNSPWDGVQVGDYGTGNGNYNTITYSKLIGNGAAGVYVHGGSGAGGTHNTISHSQFGMSSSSPSACVGGEGNAGSGVWIDQGAASTLIEYSTIGCSGSNGVTINGTGGSPASTTINMNSIGAFSTSTLPNNGEGILDVSGTNTTITENVISGNTGAGIWLNHTNTATVAKNNVGVDVAGNSAIPNGHDGIAVTDGATNVTIGSMASMTQANVISGNAWCGVRVRDGATLNTIDANLIGLNHTGTAAIPNLLAGVCVFNANNNSVGTSAGGIKQYISGNAREGIYVSASSQTFIGQTNRIGVAADEMTPLGNGLQGVMLVDASDNSVFPNRVNFNHGAGIAIIGATSIHNKVFFINNYWNDGLAVDLGNDGFTRNDPGDTDSGPNNLINYPVITSASGSPVVVNGTTCASCKVEIYWAVGNPGANRGGGVWVTEAIATSSGAWTATLPAGYTQGKISLMAIQALPGMIGDTSEMSPVYSIYLPTAVR